MSAAPLEASRIPESIHNEARRLVHLRQNPVPRTLRREVERSLEKAGGIDPRVGQISHVLEALVSERAPACFEFCSFVSCDRVFDCLDKCSRINGTNLVSKRDT